MTPPRTGRVVGRPRRAAGRVALALCLAASASAQPPGRRATTVSAILAFPNFFHTQHVILHGEFVDVGQSRRFRAAEGDDSLQVAGRIGGSGFQEIRAQFFDIGRLTRDEAQVHPDVSAVVAQQFGDQWPKPGEALVLRVLSSEPSPTPTAPTVRTVALEPGRYKDQRVTLSGQFRGRNLYGDLPNAPGVSKWDFVLKLADAAIWVTNIRPKARDLDLDVAARVDTGRWVEVSGIVRIGKGLTWVDATAGTFAATKAIVEETPEPPPGRTVGPPPEVIFSAPVEGDADVPLATSIRLQFSRDLDPATIKGHVRGSYNVQESVERGEPAPPQVELTAIYVDANRMIEVKFSKPLERFRTFKLELDSGITARDGAPLKPFTLTFVLGGS